MEVFTTLVLAAVVGFVVFLVISARKDAEHFTSRGVLYLWNSNYRILIWIFSGNTLHQNVLNIYDILKQKNKKIGGMKEMGLMTTVVQDPELIKHILIKDFDHFTDRQIFKFPKADTMAMRQLVMQKGDKWRDLRSKMSPTFTTGKIRRMFQIMKKSGDRLATFLEDMVAQSDGGEVELSVAYSKMMMDVVANTVCGIDSKAFDSKEPSVFEEMGDKLRFQLGGLRMLKLLLLVLFPKAADLFGMSLFGGEVQEFFTGAVMSSIKHREEKGEKRDDFIQLMLEARSNKLKMEEEELNQFEKDAIIKSSAVAGRDKFELDDEGIVASCVTFIVGGFDTTQSLLMFAAYSLALNPHVQDKLREEIDASLEQSDGELTYDGINKMEYLDMVINETLRIYPAAAQTDRECVEDYKLPGTDFVIRKGERVLIPILGLHHDEKYWPEPEKFDPERFSRENKGKINHYTFLPFGQGPRNCIGMRFALTEVKLAIAHLIRHFRVEPSKKTLIPMKYDNQGALKPKGGMWLALRKRIL